MPAVFDALPKNLRDAGIGRVNELSSGWILLSEAQEKDEVIKLLLAKLFQLHAIKDK